MGNSATFSCDYLKARADTLEMMANCCDSMANNMQELDLEFVHYERGKASAFRTCAAVIRTMAEKADDK